jgi:hypothetical protein
MSVRTGDMEVHILADVDVLVVGGGVAGVAAAIAAGRQGARVLLVERHNSLGGSATSGMMALFYTPYLCTHGLMREIVDRLAETGGAFPGDLIPFDHEALKVLFLDMLRSEGVQVLFHTFLVDALLHDRSVRGVLVANKSGLSAILSRVVIDSSGDADVAYRSGTELVLGRESDNKMRPASLLFRMGGIDVERTLDYVKKNPEDFSPDPNQTMVDRESNNIRLFGFFGLVEEAKRNGDLYEDCHYFRIETVMPSKGTAVVNTSRIYGVDGTNPFDVTAAEIEGRRQMISLDAFARKYVPGFERAYILDTAGHIGIRETRRLVGKYVLQEADIAEGRRFPDSITVDSNRNSPGGEKGHSPDGGEGSATDPDIRNRRAPLVTYEIPFRSLLPRDINDLLVAGRSISATHSADAFTRNQPACIGTGQAAGTIAGLSIKRALSPASVDVGEVRETLRRAGVVLDRLEMKQRIEQAGGRVYSPA